MTDLENRIFLNDGVEYDSMFKLFGKKKSDKTDENRRDFLKKSGIAVAGTYAVAKGFGLGNEAKAKEPSYDFISKEAYKIWRNYPEMIELIDILNADGDRRLVASALFPNQNWSSGGALVFNNVKDVPLEDMQSPQYWLLLKLHSPRDKIFYQIAYESRERKGIPKIRNKGVDYFARGLLHKNKNREQDLLKALYIGATGSENGAIPIIDGSYMNMQKVKDKVKEWKDKDNYAPYSNKGNLLNAYFTFGIRGNFKNPELVALSLLTLATNSNGEKAEIYVSTISDSVDRGNAPYYLIEENNNKVSMPLKIF